MEEVKKITPEELSQLQAFDGQIKQNTFELGQFNIDLYNLELQKESVETEKKNTLEVLKTLTQQQSQMLETLKNKYGEGRLDLNTGEIFRN
jgi:beta-xylosidase